MIPFSVVIITRNEEQFLPQCLRSLDGLGNEIIVVDDYSTDRTPEICKSWRVRYIQHHFEGHIEQKNFALSQASHPWVLSLDADEALTDTLRHSIRQVMQAPDCDGYSFNRLNYYCGKPIRHGGWYPDRKLRLFNRTKGRWGGINPHDTVVMEPGSRIRKIKGSLKHHAYDSVREHIDKVYRYTDIYSRDFINKKKSAGLRHLLVNPFWKLVRNYFLRLGFLDGKEGLYISAIQAWETYMKYHKILHIKRMNARTGHAAPFPEVSPIILRQNRKAG